MIIIQILICRYPFRMKDATNTSLLGNVDSTTSQTISIQNTPRGNKDNDNDENLIY